MEIEPLPPEPDADSDPEPLAGEVASANRRFLVAMTVYAVLAILATIRLDGRPRLVVWIFLGLFAIKTLLLVLKQRAG